MYQNNFPRPDDGGKPSFRFNRLFKVWEVWNRHSGQWQESQVGEGLDLVDGLSQFDRKFGVKGWTFVGYELSQDEPSELLGV